MMFPGKNHKLLQGIHDPAYTPAVRYITIKRLDEGSLSSLKKKITTVVFKLS